MIQQQDGKITEIRHSDYKISRQAAGGGHGKACWGSMPMGPLVTIIPVELYFIALLAIVGL